MLTYYELDLGLNHVVRKYTETLQEFSNMLIPGTLQVYTVNFSGKILLQCIKGTPAYTIIWC